MTRRYVGNRYRLVRRLGRGAMGEVWQAYDEELQRNVALKFLHRFDNPILVERFRREGRSMAAVVDDRVIKVLDMNVSTSFADGQIPYLVMEELPGPNLGEVMAQRRRLEFGPAAALAADVATALNAAHRVGIVHRDIKPSNLMFDKGGRLKVLDFGIASMLNDASMRLTATGEAIGTPAYFAPEQAKGMPAVPGSDIYALGCVLFEMIAGRLPFDVHDGPAQLIQRVMNDAPRLTSLVAVPRTVDDLVARMLARQPEQRPGAAELMVVLAEIAVDASAASFTAIDLPAMDVAPVGESGPDDPVPVRRNSAGHRADLPRWARLRLLVGFGAVIAVCVAAVSLVIASVVSNLDDRPAAPVSAAMSRCHDAIRLPKTYAAIERAADQLRTSLCPEGSAQTYDGHRERALQLLDRLEKELVGQHLATANATVASLGSAIGRVEAPTQRAIETIQGKYDALKNAVVVVFENGV